MALETINTASRPLISQSVLRQLRAGAAIRKHPLGPETTKAMVEGSLEKDVELAKADADRQARMKIETQALEEQATLDSAKIYEARAARKTQEQEQSYLSGLFGS